VPHDQSVLFGGEALRLPQDLVGDAKFADVIDKTALYKESDILVGKTKPGTENSCNESRVKAVGMGHIIFTGKHIVEIVQKKLTTLGTYNDIAINLHELLHFDGSRAAYSTHHEVLENREINLISVLKIFKAFTEAHLLKVGSGKIHIFLDGNDHDGLPSQLLNDGVRNLGIGANDDLILVVEDILSSDHTGL
jgi:hypothetical protein